MVIILLGINDLLHILVVGKQCWSYWSTGTPKYFQMVFVNNKRSRITVLSLSELNTHQYGALSGFHTVKSYRT